MLVGGQGRGGGCLLFIEKAREAEDQFVVENLNLEENRNMAFLS